MNKKNRFCCCSYFFKKTIAHYWFVEWDNNSIGIHYIRRYQWPLDDFAFRSMSYAFVICSKTLIKSAWMVKLHNIHFAWNVNRNVRTIDIRTKQDDYVHIIGLFLSDQTKPYSLLWTKKKFINFRPLGNIFFSSFFSSNLNYA